MSERQTQLIHESLRRCDRDPGFLDRFYEVFLGTSPEVREKFVGTDMTRQKRAVEASLYTAILAAEGTPFAVEAIEELGRTHRALHIRRDLYELWLDSLLRAVETYDDEFDAEVENAWRAVLGSVIDMILGEEPATTSG